LFLESFLGNKKQVPPPLLLTITSHNYDDDDDDDEPLAHMQCVCVTFLQYHVEEI